MKLRGLLSLAAPALLLTTPLASADDAVDLKPRWISGKRYYQTTKMVQATKMEIAGQKMEQNVATTMDVVTTVTAHTDPTKQRLAQKYGRISMDMSVAGQKIQFDSSKPDAPDPLGIGKTLGAMVGKELQLVIDQNGKISEFENMDELLKPLAAANPLTAQMTNSLFSKEAIAQGFDQAALKALPGKPVKPGDHWPFNVTMPLPQIGGVTIKGSYTYKGMTDHAGVKCAEIAQDSTLTMTLDNIGAGTEQAAAIKQLAMKMDSGVLKGTIWFDPALGASREAELKQTMMIHMKDPTQNGKQVDLPMNQTVTVTLTKVEDVK